MSAFTGTLSIGTLWHNAYRCLLVLIMAMACTVVQAHESSTAYLNLQAPNAKNAASTNYKVEYELSLRDLALLIDIDPNKDNQISWAEVKSQTPLIKKLITAQVTLSADSAVCEMTNLAPLAINTRGGFNYLYTDYDLLCTQAIDSLDYQVLAGIDANHRLILTQANANYRCKY